MKLIVTRGLPGSGKSSWVAKQIEEFGIVRVESDLIRRMIHGKQFVLEYEPLVHEIKKSCIKAILEHDSVDTVIDDECNLSDFFVNELMSIANLYHAEFEIKDFRYVSVEECIRRDALRPEGKRVGEEVILKMVKRYGYPS